MLDAASLKQIHFYTSYAFGHDTTMFCKWCQIVQEARGFVASHGADLS
jgi:hypothetical protein